MSKQQTIPLKKVQNDLIEIIQLLKQLYTRVPYCIELQQSQKTIQNLILESAQHLMHLQQLITEKFPNFNIGYDHISELSDDFNLDLQKPNHAVEQDIAIKTFNLQQMDNSISHTTILLDRTAINCKFCPDLGVRPYVLQIAKAMCELFEIQHSYIYPLRADLMPEYLRKKHKDPN